MTTAPPPDMQKWHFDVSSAASHHHSATSCYVGWSFNQDVFSLLNSAEGQEDSVVVLEIDLGLKTGLETTFQESWSRMQMCRVSNPKCLGLVLIMILSRLENLSASFGAYDYNTIRSFFMSTKHHRNRLF